MNLLSFFFFGLEPKKNPYALCTLFKNRDPIDVIKTFGRKSLTFNNELHMLTHPTHNNQRIRHPIWSEHLNNIAHILIHQ